MGKVLPQKLEEQLIVCKLALHVEKEGRSLGVADTIVGGEKAARVVVADVGVECRVLAVLEVALTRVVQEGIPVKFFFLQLLLDGVLEKHGQALVEPDAIPVLARDKVSAPRVCHFVEYQPQAVNLGLCHPDLFVVSKRQHDIFHRKTLELRKQQHLVFLPLVGPNLILESLQIYLQVAHEILVLFDNGGMADDRCSRRQLVLDEVSCRQRHQISANRLVDRKSKLVPLLVRLINDFFHQFSTAPPH